MDRKMAEKSSDLDRFLDSFAKDLQAKLQGKVDATRRVETGVKRLKKNVCETSVGHCLK